MPKLKADVSNVGFSKMLSSLSKKIKDIKDFEKSQGEYWENAKNAISALYLGGVKAYLGDTYRTGRLYKSIKADTTSKTIRIYSDKEEFKGTGIGPYEPSKKKINYYAPWVEEGTRDKIYPKHVKYFVFKSKPREINGAQQRWFTKPWVHGQEGLHFMRGVSQDKYYQQTALEIMEHFAIQCILGDWRNKKGTRQGIALSRIGRKQWSARHGGKAFPTRWNRGS